MENRMSSKNTPLYMLIFWILSTMLWWGVAFAPFGGEAPEWLLTTKYACFGTLPNGLPDASGWLLLTLGPLSFLVGLFVAWPQEIKLGVRQFLSKRTGMAATLILALTLSAEVVLVAREIKVGLRISNFDFSNDSQDDLPNEYPRSQIQASDFSLVDQGGQTLKLSDLKGEVVVLTFAFAHCATVCPTLVYQAKQGFLEAALENTRFLVITLDPWRDRPSTLLTLFEKWKMPPRSHILSGEVKVVTDVISRYGITTSRNLETGDIVHPSMIYVIDQDGKLAFTFNNAPSRWITQAIRRLKNFELAGMAK